MIMAFTQRFRLDRGEWCCAGCGAVMTERTEDQAVVMNHRADCPETSGAQASGA
jgi:transcription initiation factor TFIIIB Brf1 subunit/transcription initiation factor TFIIB